MSINSRAKHVFEIYMASVSLLGTGWVLAQVVSSKNTGSNVKLESVFNLDSKLISHDMSMNSTVNAFSKFIWLPVELLRLHICLSSDFA